MAYEWDERDDEVAAGAICPMPECGALAVAFGAMNVVGRDHPEPREFTCPRCGLDFVTPEDELTFQSVPKYWLLARVQSA